MEPHHWPGLVTHVVGLEMPGMSLSLGVTVLPVVMWHLTGILTGASLTCIVGAVAGIDLVGCLHLYFKRNS